MKFSRIVKWAGLSAVAALLLRPEAAHACAACFGKSDSPLAQGMNWGIFSLMGVVVTMLGGIAGFFVFLAKRSAALSAAASAPAPAVPAIEPAIATNKA